MSDYQALQAEMEGLCWSCYRRQRTTRLYEVCFECKHAYTHFGLIWADWMVRLWLNLHYRDHFGWAGWLPRRAKRIYVCPCCTHDL